MTAKTETPATIKPFVISRTFNAPRELLWKCWTDPEHLKHWMGPKGAVVGYTKMDFRVGGTHHYCMQFAGQELWGKQVFREINRPEKFVYVNSFSDENAGLTHHPMSPTWPLELLTTITFEERDGKTTVTIEWLPINASAEELKTFDNGRASMNQGWGGSLDALGEYLAKQ